MVVRFKALGRNQGLLGAILLLGCAPANDDVVTYTTDSVKDGSPKHSVWRLTEDQLALAETILEHSDYLFWDSAETNGCFFRSYLLGMFLTAQNIPSVQLVVEHPMGSRVLGGSKWAVHAAPVVWNQDGNPLVVDRAVTSGDRTHGLVPYKVWRDRLLPKHMVGTISAYFQPANTPLWKRQREDYSVDIVGSEILTEENLPADWSAVTFQPQVSTEAVSKLLEIHKLIVERSSCDLSSEIDGTELLNRLRRALE